VFIDVADKIEGSTGSYSYSASMSSADTVAMILVALTPDGSGTGHSARLAQIAAEVLGEASDPAARLAQISVEAMVAASNPEARFALISVEVLAGLVEDTVITPPVPSGRIKPGQGGGGGQNPGQPKGPQGKGALGIRPIIGEKIRLGEG
jgi:hypothetical protein